MPSGTERHDGYRIKWASSLTSDSGLWNANATIVSVSRTSGVPEAIHAITGECFSSEADARDYVLRAARQWIESRERRQNFGRL